MNYEKDKAFAKLLSKVESKEKIFEKEESILMKTKFVDQNENINRYLILYSFDGPFQLLHADIANLEFLGKSAANPKYCLLFVNLFTSKAYTYPIKIRKLIAK